VQVFTARYRLKFLQLTDAFLASSLVPAYTAAAFIKRFARIAVNAPPAGTIICIAFMHNLLRRHPSCTCMLHQPTAANFAVGGKLGVDVYDEPQADPAESHAVESSLWELEILRMHQNTMVCILLALVCD
jgi:U3 small nucleolar RNA-associated protein 19